MAAAKIIRKARARADKVRQLLRDFGDNEETLALNLRFQRLRVTIEAADVDAETAARYAKLTVAVHDLNYMLSQEFYPGK